MTSHEFTKIRNILGKSQGSLAKLLGTSIRSVQAYEQGWREIPHQAERMILYLLYQKRRGQRSIRPCWKIKKCSTQWREDCPAWEYQAQGPCWFLNGEFCEGKNCMNWDEKMQTCRDCPVFMQVMGGSEEMAIA